MTRVLVISEAANPDLVSVPLVGWSLARAIGRHAEVHIVTQVRNRDAFLRAGLREGADFTALDTEPVARPLWRLSRALGGAGKGWTTKQAISAVSYAWFERLLWRTLGPRIAAGEWDVVHRVTPLTPTQPSHVAPRCRAAGVPFVMGPLNGGVPWPPGFGAARRREREWLSYVRGAYKLMPGRAATLASAAAILTGSRHTMGEIPAAYRDKTIYLPENAVDPDRFARRAAPGSTGLPLRACFVGRLVPYKGPDMLIEAAAPLLKAGDLRLEVIGDGPMMAALRAQAAAAGVAGAVVFHGWVEHRDVQVILSACDLLAFPSIREFGGGVVLEAMALGLPPLVVDYAGPGELVTEDTGRKVPVGDRAAIVAGTRAALADCVRDPGALAAMGAAGRARVAAGFTWEAKAAQVMEVYDWVLGRRPDRPEPF